MTEIHHAYRGGFLEHTLSGMLAQKYSDYSRNSIRLSIVT